MDKTVVNKKSKPLSLFLIILLVVVFLSSCAKISDTDTADTAPADDGDDENDPCGNALGNGDEIISGPSGPSGADYDSVFRSLTVDPTNPGIVIIGTERNGFVKSTDGGVNWTRLRYGLRHDDIVFASSNNNIVYAVTKGYLLYKSEDGGVTFSLVKNIRSDVLNVIS